ncbi:toll/interleukin-1 receptor domain-containing protein [Stieleria varia]|uniref:TIR domain-containing protein n=1 Tax=Stieleria varia TaxID=2528005 RepID=A0A5C6B8T3_9BACT|nr:toll/interleukin-1 receptor domain-containing protein [Stieleria varia]TWU08052.1 hypothetical protein Pla52n_06300 [Stieleria varia]
MTKIFINYRRDDSAHFAGRICERLEREFGSNDVFMDVDNIPLGVDFRQHLHDAVSRCSVMIVVIGDKWLQVIDDSGARRLDDPKDFVRIEIESAIKNEIVIIPVLPANVAMPREEDLPETLRPLAFRNALSVSHTTKFQNQLDPLVETVRRVTAVDTPVEAIVVAEGPAHVASESIRQTSEAQCDVHDGQITTASILKYSFWTAVLTVAIMFLTVTTLYWTVEIPEKLRGGTLFSLALLWSLLIAVALVEIIRRKRRKNDVGV